MANTQGFNFYYDKLQLSASGLKIIYDFLPTSGNEGYTGLPITSINSISGGNPVFSGTLSNATSGGIFTGQYVDIVSGGSLNSPAWTTFLLFEKSDKQDGVLFSNYHGDDIKSGYVIGVNSANRLYIESFDENGPIIHEADFDLGSKNAVAVTKNYNNLNISYFDFNKKETLTTNFFVSDLSFRDSEDWSLAKAINSPSYFSGHYFDGIIEKFIYITGTIFPYEIETLFNGFTLYKKPEYYYTVVDESCNYSNIGLTGSITNISFEKKFQMSYCVETGILNYKTGEVWSNITGIISGLNLYVSGLISGYTKEESFFSNTYTGITGYTDIVTGTGYQSVSSLEKITLGNFGDECQNIFDITGVLTSNDLVPYDLISRVGLSGLITESGIEIINVPFSIPVNYSGIKNISALLLENGFFLQLENSNILQLQGNTTESDNSSFVYSSHYNKSTIDFGTKNVTLRYTNTGIQSTPFFLFKNCSQIYGYKLEDLQFNIDYILQFGMEGVTYINTISSQDYSELYIFPESSNKFNLNNDVKIDTSQSTYILENNPSLNQLNLYENGVALRGSIYNLTGNNYISGVELIADYAISGNNALTATPPDVTDIVILDKIFGNRVNYTVPDSYTFSGITFINNLTLLNSSLYLNGVKLLSGNDYIQSGNNVVILNSGLTGVSGNMFILPNDSENYLRYTGKFSEQTTEKFARGTSMLWANGVRQKLGQDYLEISKSSLLEGDRIYPSGTNVILNNDENWWE